MSFLSFQLSNKGFTRGGHGCLPRNKLHADSSEILNWVALAGAAEGIDLNWFEYVPGYRTPAGTGTGMSFATWG